MRALFRAARYCNSQPWELRRRSVMWRNYALLLDDAETLAKHDIESGAVPARSAIGAPAVADDEDMFGDLLDEIEEDNSW